jgi:Holliday junction resolvase RusA-like endonuclease
MTEPIIFLVSGEPRAKQSTRFDGHGHAHTDPKVKAWQDHVSARAREAMQGREPLTGPVAVRAVFVLGNKRRVDCENLVKAVNDAMNGIVFVDDHQVVSLHVVKHVKANPGVFVAVYPGGLLPMLDNGA